MIATDEDSLICDLAETYHVFNYRELPVKLLATLSVGLRADSRIKLKISEQPCSLEIWLLASIADRLTLIGSAGSKEKPKLITDMLLQKESEQLQTFASGEDFVKAREKMLKGSD
jgi:hypothetical protein